MIDLSAICQLRERWERTAATLRWQASQAIDDGDDPLAVPSLLGIADGLEIAAASLHVMVEPAGTGPRCGPADENVRRLSEAFDSSRDVVAGAVPPRPGATVVHLPRREQG